MTSEPWERFNSPDDVEEQYVKTCIKLTEAEVNAAMFTKMVRSGVATNNVRNFVAKQCKMKKTNQKMSRSLLKSAMKSKLSDACANANRLRQDKRRLMNILIHRFNFSRSKCKCMVRSALLKAKNHRQTRRNKAERKYQHCEQKMKKTFG